MYKIGDKIEATGTVVDINEMGGGERTYCIQTEQGTQFWVHEQHVSASVKPSRKPFLKEAK